MSSPRSTKKLPIAIRSAVWNHYIGEHSGSAKCFVGCGTTIFQNTFQCGHKISKYNGGPDTINNLRPICQRCNTSMGSQNLDEFMTQYGLTNDTFLDRLSPNMREMFPSLYLFFKI